MFKRLSFLVAFLVFIFFFTIANFNLTFKNYSSNQILYKGSKSSLAKQIQFERLNPISFLGITGESCTVYEDLQIEELLKDFNAVIIHEEKLEGLTNYYCYSPKIKHGIKILGKTVNLHIAKSNEKTVLGTPIIFGSY